MKLRPLEFRILLSERGMTVPEVAEKAGLQPECIYANLRNSDRSLRWDTLWRLCQALGCEPQEIAVLAEYERDFDAEQGEHE
ncbi:helix-turn-helix transcriptional regulator [bacterium]|nr:helix-turn-helix transcriptional regulator [bacterium]